MDVGFLEMPDYVCVWYVCVRIYIVYIILVWMNMCSDSCWITFMTYESATNSACWCAYLCDDRHACPYNCMIMYVWTCMKKLHTGIHLVQTITYLEIQEHAKAPYTSHTTHSKTYIPGSTSSIAQPRNAKLKSPSGHQPKPYLSVTSWPSQHLVSCFWAQSLLIV